jgi:hypothetical protein
MAVPVITGIAPNVGKLAGGTTVTITGTNLGTPTAVHFGATACTVFGGASATEAFAVSPAGTGTVHVTLTTAGGTSATSAADPFTYSGALFTVAEARAFDRAQLNDSPYTDADVEAAEAEIRERFRRQCGVSFVEMSSTDLLDGCYHYPAAVQVSQHNPLREQPPRPIVVTAASIDGVSFSAPEIADLVSYPDGRIVRRTLGYWYGDWPNSQNISLTYTHGWATTPAAIKRVALRVCMQNMLTSDFKMLDARMTSFSDGSANYSLITPGRAGAWYMDPEVNQVLSEYSEERPGIA